MAVNKDKIIKAIIVAAAVVTILQPFLPFLHETFLNNKIEGRLRHVQKVLWQAFTEPINASLPPHESNLEPSQSASVADNSSTTNLKASYTYSTEQYLPERVDFQDGSAILVPPRAFIADDPAPLFSTANCPQVVPADFQNGGTEQFLPSADGLVNKKYEHEEGVDRQLTPDLDTTTIWSFTRVTIVKPKSSQPTTQTTQQP